MTVYTRKAPFAEALCVEGSDLPLRGLCHPGKEAELRVLGHVLVELFPMGSVIYQIRHDVRPFVLVNSDFIAVDLHS